MTLDKSQYARLHAILGDARELRGAALDEFLARACGDHEKLRAEVLELLAAGRADDTKDPFGDEHVAGVRQALEGALDGATTDWLPDKVGDYTILRQIGRGGMGVVYEAEQESPHRRVAIKLLHPMQATPERLRLFQREAQTLGRFQHPGIAQIFEAGVYDDGRGEQPFFAMELIEGTDILTYCMQEKLPLAARIELLARVADAVDYANEHDVVHRDLKPDNVLIDGQGQPRILDFGIARVTSHTSTLSTLTTVQGRLVGTLAYMAPELLREKPDEVTPQVDVYALGVLGFELLTGRPPRDIGGMSAPQAIAVLSTTEPPRAGTMDTRLRGDLEVILGKALESERDRRYDSAAALAGDLRRHLADQPILARPPSGTYLLRKFARRNKALVGGVVTTLIVTITGAIVATSYAIDARSANETLTRTNTDLVIAREAADANANAAEESAQRAEQAATREKLRADEVLQLSDLQDLDDLIDQAQAAWPAHPGRLAAYRAWIAAAEELLAGLPAHRAKRDELRTLALPRTEQERLAERRAHPRWLELIALDRRIGSLRRSDTVRRGDLVPETVELIGVPDEMSYLVPETRRLVDLERTEHGSEARGLAVARRAMTAAGPNEQGRVGVLLARAFFANGLDAEALEACATARNAATSESERLAIEPQIVELSAAIEAAREGEPLASLERERELLDALVDERRDHRFPAEETTARWWEAQITKLIDGLEALSDSGTGLFGPGSPTAGWGISRRIEEARRLEHALVPDGAWHERWASAVPEIEAAHPGIDLPVQVGLVPLGPDPRSGLWEFWHAQTGDEPQRNMMGTLVITEETGLVFVLIPGGDFVMGAQKYDGAAPNHDAFAMPDEGAVHEVTLSPFLLSKHEMTQAQWERFVGRNPSEHREGFHEAVTDRNPVESVSWDRAVEALTWMGLELPTEAQWEYACRAGTMTPYSCPPEDLRLVANLGDETYADKFRELRPPEPWRDGFPTHAPVGSFLANPFGLHDMHGNVWEWCLDGYEEPDAYAGSAVTDPLRIPDTTSSRVRRGGSYNSSAAFVRSPVRVGNKSGFSMSSLGVRPARRIVRD